MIDPATAQIPVKLPLSVGKVSWKLIGSALELLPFKDAVPAINELNAQINAFLSPAPQAQLEHPANDTPVG